MQLHTNSNIKNIKMPEHHNFGSIDHFKNFLHEVRSLYRHAPEESKPKEIRLRGTVKLHGTHADFVSEKDKDGSWTSWCQSRNRVISIENDNAGFAKFMNGISIDKKWKLISSTVEIYRKNGEKNGPIVTLMIAGEFCGGNIQKTVALCKLQSMFVIFSVIINGVTQHFPDYHDIQIEDENVYNISRAPIYNAILILNEPEKIVKTLRDLTNAVEKECPFAKTFGISGIGEGVVWVAEGLPNHRFKVKGDEHTVSRVKTLDEQTEADLTALKDAKVFARNAVLEPRLKQGLDYLREMNLDTTIKNIGTYLKWIVEDVEKEEGDMMKKLNLSPKLVRKEVYAIAKVYYNKNVE